MQFIIFAIGIIWLVAKLGWGWSIFWAILLVILAVIAGIIEGKRKQAETSERAKNQNEKVKNLIKICNSLIIQHIQELSTKEQQLVFEDGYGLKNTKNWEKEKGYFIKSIIEPKFEGELILTEESISLSIDKAITQFREKYPDLAFRGFSDDLSPLEYEQHCAKLLRDAGWNAQTTIATGDQGADVIATKGATKVVLQCKKYSQPVGNKAVQEAHAAKGFYNADRAAVVSNASYTPSAKKVAGKLNVLLLHHNDLATFN